MNNTNPARYLLHVSDFHLNDNQETLNHARKALTVLSHTLKVKGIKVDYLVHTGDIIDSHDLVQTAARKILETELNEAGTNFFEYKEFFENCFIKTQDNQECYSNKDGHEEQDDVSLSFCLKAFTEKAPPELIELFDEYVKKLVENRFSQATSIMQEFISKLNVAPGNVVICCGNHDVLRPLALDEGTIKCSPKGNDDGWIYSDPEKAEIIFQPFEDFLNSLEVANSKKRCKQDDQDGQDVQTQQNKQDDHNGQNVQNSQEGSVTYCTLGNLNILVLNTNWKNPQDQKPGYFCIYCEQIKNSLIKLNSQKDSGNMLNMVIAHKPIYEICERPRLPYKRYIETPFMSELQKFIGDNGIYLCGDKHTRSITGSSFHDIHHYLGGEPLRISESGDIVEVEYNLLEISKNQLGMERKIHLTSTEKDNWICTIRPQDTIVSQLYALCEKYIVNYSFVLIESVTGSHRESSKPFPTWDSLCQKIHGWDSTQRVTWANNLNDLFTAICKYRQHGVTDSPFGKTNIFDYLLSHIKDQINNGVTKNILNIRGEYDSGKSTFLGLFFIYLLYKYSIGCIDFIPAYFNLENNEMFIKIKGYSSYYEAAKQTFDNFSNKIQKIANKEHQKICYIIDGIDELDCWSYSTEDSIGRGLLDILSECDDSWYVMSFSQHRLPCFKNTMPVRKYNDSSDIMYFNPVDIREEKSLDSRFSDCVHAFFKLLPPTPAVLSAIQSVEKSNKSKISISSEDYSKLAVNICDLIRKFRRLTVSPGFLYQNYDFLITKAYGIDKTQSTRCLPDDIFKYYIDRQEEICLKELGYGFVDYAPAMAYLFTFKGYTYERFKRLHVDDPSESQHVFGPIFENHDKIYRAFLFIKQHNDAREYLIALHYNREIRYYVEHPNEDIADDSILNDFINRNISVLIRMLWSDTNKFTIACKRLLRRDKLSNCLQSILIYCLAHMQMYKPIRDSLKEELQRKAEETLLRQFAKEQLEDIGWDINGNDSTEKLRNFLNLSLLHTLTIYSLSDGESSFHLAKAMLLSEKSSEEDKLSEKHEISSDMKDYSKCITKGFRRYNRQFLRLYYGDLFIRGEDRQRPLDPNDDLVGKGFDFHNCFNHLFEKLSSNDPYPLREFDLYAMLDLIQTRLSTDYLNEHCTPEINPPDTFFYRGPIKGTPGNILRGALSIVEEYEKKHLDDDHKFLVGMADIIKECLAMDSKNQAGSQQGDQLRTA